MTGPPKRPRVLVIAEAANPEWVSVPLVGWSMAQALRGVADVHLVTQVRNRDAILRAGLIEGTDFTAIDSEALAAPVSALAEMLRGGDGKGWTMVQAMSLLSYPWFEKLIWQSLGSRIEAGEWDIVHRVTPLSPTQSSPIAARIARAGVPFVLGPLNGGVPWPAGFESVRKAEREWLSTIRGAYRWLPGRQATLRHASAILTGSRHTASEVPAAFQEKVIWLPENGVDPARFVAARPASDRLRAVFVGRLVPYKGPDMALASAAPLLRAGKMTFDIVGDGPMMADLRAQAAAEGIEAAVTFHGWLPQEGVAQVMEAATLLLFPSIREFGGGVVLEAMMMGVVPLVVDYAGPGELVTEAWAKVAPGPRESIVAALRERLSAMVADPAALAAMGARSRVRALRDFTWDAKARQVVQVYNWILDGSRGPAPVLLEGGA